MIKQKTLLLVAIYLLLHACTGIKSNNGYMPVGDSIDRLKVGVSSLNLQTNLGEPALV